MVRLEMRSLGSDPEVKTIPLFSRFLRGLNGAAGNENWSLTPNETIPLVVS